MFRTLRSSLLLLSLAFFSVACAEDLSNVRPEGAALRSLYTVSWNTDQTRVSVLVPGADSTVGEGQSNICKEGHVSGDALVCPDRLVHLGSGAEAYFPTDLRAPRDAALGEFDRIAYVLDRSGDLHVTDTGWSAAASDDRPLLLWTPGGDHVELVAGNAKRELAVVELTGGLTVWAVDADYWYALYRNPVEGRWAWGVERVSLIDYRVEAVGAEQVVDHPEDVPQELVVTDEGHLKIYRDGAVLVELPL